MNASSIASLMLQTNALISIEVTVNLCSLSISEINYRIQNGRFPEPLNLSMEPSNPIYAFHIQDIQKWLNSPSEYYASQSGVKDKGFNMSYD
jgi:predicted DNA-binding transcriptional regulator AlpA